jgi:hypothetical protein
MPEDYEKESPEIDEDAKCEAHREGMEEEYEEEEITSEEVDRVLESLTNLLESVESETVHEYLEETYNQIFSLIYEEEEVTEEEVTEEEVTEEEVTEEEVTEEDEMVALEEDEVDFEDDLRNEEAA